MVRIDSPRLAAGLLLALLFAIPARAQGADSAPDRDPWPRTASAPSGKVTIYQPQVEKWKGDTLTFHAAVAIEAPGTAAPEYGVVYATARTDVNKDDRLVTLWDMKLTRAKFPARPDSTASYLRSLRALVPASTRTIALDRLTASLLAVAGKEQAHAAPVKNAPPTIHFSPVPAMLVLINGPPVVKPAPVSSLQRVVNTGVLIAFDGFIYYLHVFDGWLQASSLGGPWVVAWNAPPALDTLLSWAKTQRIDLLTAKPADPEQPTPSLWSNTVPVIYMSTTPAELVVTQGAPNYTSIPGTDLLYVSNTSAYVFEDIDDQRMYVLLGGRWFSAPGTSGPWSYVPASKLPRDFWNIPLDSPVEPVLASLPGTPQAQEALIENSIPQTAAVSRSESMPAPQIDGAPQLVPIAGTSLSYVFNSPTPIIRVAPGAYYAVYNAVWFSGPSATGPWTVAAYVPAAIYTIPPSSPVYYVTYVQVYGSTSTVVYVGYTPGYFGTVATPSGVVVYGTGYVYPAYVGVYYYYPPPMTYGFGAVVCYSPTAGWSVAYGAGYSYGGVSVSVYYGGAMYAPHPYYGPAYYGTYYGSATNVYGHYGSTTYSGSAYKDYNPYTGNGYSHAYGSSYNSATGVASSGQRSTYSNSYTGSYQSYAAGTKTNTNTGSSFTGTSATYGNAYTGQHATTASGTYTSGVTGQSTQVNAAHTSSGTAVQTSSGTYTHSANDVYGDQSGNVYKDNGNGSWSQWGGSSGSSGKSSGGSSGWNSWGGSSSMNTQAASRSYGSSRESGYSGSGGGGGGRR